jgi:hypothetical protein
MGEPAMAVAARATRDFRLRNRGGEGKHAPPFKEPVASADDRQNRSEET